MKPSSERKSQERDGPWCHIGMVVEGFADFGLIYAILEVWHFRPGSLGFVQSIFLRRARKIRAKHFTPASSIPAK